MRYLVILALLCGVQAMPPRKQSTGSCDCRPASIVFQLTSTGCGDSTNPQGGKFDCGNESAGAAGPTTVTVLNGDGVATPSSLNVGDTFELTNDGRLEAQTDFELRGMINMDLSIHTSCSQTLNGGDIYGALTVVSFICSSSSSSSMGSMGMDSAPAPVPVPVPVDPGMGGMGMDDTPAPVVPEEGQENVLLIEGEFTGANSEDVSARMIPAIGELTLATCVNLDGGNSGSLVSNGPLAWTYDGTTDTISLGTQFGNGDSCDVTTSPLGTGVDGDGPHHLTTTVRFVSSVCNCRPSNIVFRVGATGCSDSTNPQGGKFTCSGTSGAAGAVSIVVDGGTVTPTTVNVGETFILENAGRLNAQTDFTLSGAVSQELSIHTSCSQTLLVGDIYGALEVVSFSCSDGENGNGISEDDIGISTVTFYVDGVMVGQGTCNNYPPFLLDPSLPSAVGAGLVGATYNTLVFNDELQGPEVADLAENFGCPIDTCEYDFDGSAGGPRFATPEAGPEFSMFSCVRQEAGNEGDVISSDEIAWSSSCSSNTMAMALAAGQCGAQSVSDPRICDGAFHNLGVVVSVLQECQCRSDWIDFRYIGGDCAQSNQPQEGKATCTGDALNPASGSVTVSLVDTDGSVIDMGGNIFRLQSSDGTVDAQSTFSISDGVGTQIVSIHTSCSKPLGEGDIFGSLQLTAFSDNCGDDASGSMGGMSSSSGDAATPTSVQVDFYVDNCIVSSQTIECPQMPSVEELSLVLGNNLDGELANTEFYDFAMDQTMVANRDNDTNCCGPPSPTRSPSPSPSASPSPSPSPSAIPTGRLRFGLNIQGGGGSTFSQILSGSIFYDIIRCDSHVREDPAGVNAANCPPNVDGTSFRVPASMIRTKSAVGSPLTDTPYVQAVSDFDSNICLLYETNLIRRDNDAITGDPVIEICDSTCMDAEEGAVQSSFCDGEGIDITEVQDRIRDAIDAHVPDFSDGSAASTAILENFLQTATGELCIGEVVTEFAVNLLRVPQGTAVSVNLVIHPRVAGDRCNGSPGLLCYDTRKGSPLHGLFGDADLHVCASEFILGSTAATMLPPPLNMNSDPTLNVMAGDVADRGFSISTNGVGCSNAFKPWEPAQVAAGCPTSVTTRLCFVSECP